MHLRGSLVDQKLPVVAAEFKGVLQHIPDTLIGRRDRAMLACVLQERSVGQKWPPYALKT